MEIKMKKPYIKPSLKNFGKVAQLTQKGGSGTDAGVKGTTSVTTST